jgi:tetratricopeptide (TPR) repeat protein
MLIAYIALLTPKERRGKDILKTLPFFVITALFLLFKTKVLGAFFSGQRVISIEPHSHILLVFKTIGYYFRLLISPFDFNVERALSIPSRLFEPGVILSLIFIIFCAAIGWSLYKRGQREALFSLFWIFIALLPAANIIFLVDRPIAEQRLYAPSVGFCLILSFAACSLFKMDLRQLKSKPFKSFVGLLVFALLSSYSIATVRRNNDWKDPIRFWSVTIKANPNSAKAYFNLANEYMAVDQYREAIPYYERSIEIDPAKPDVYNNLGAAHKKLGDDDMAVKFYEKSISTQPGYAQAYVNLGMHYAETGRADEAEEMYNRAIKHRPYYAEAYNNLGILYEKKGDPDKALEYYDQAIRVNDLYATAYYNKGVLYAKREMADRALFFFKKTIEIDNSHSDAYFNLGIAYNAFGRKEEAGRMLRKSIEIDAQPDAYMILSMIYTETGNIDNAAKALEDLVKIDPGLGGAYHRLAEIYYVQKRYGLAIKNCDKAVELGVVDNGLLDLLKPARKGLD